MNKLTRKIIRLLPPKTPLNGKIFLLAVAAECALLILLGIVYIVLDPSSVARALITLMTLISLGYFAFDSILTENRFQLVIWILLSLVLLLRLLAHAVWPAEADRSIAQIAVIVVALVVSILFELGLVALAVVVPNNISTAFGYYHFQFVSAAQRVQDMYRSYQAFVTLAKLDALLAFTWFLLVAEKALLVPTLLTLADAALGCLWALACWRAVFCEDGFALHGLLAVAWIHPTYAAYCSVVLPKGWDTGDVMTAGCCVVLVRVLLLIWTLKMSRHLHHGLLDLHRQIRMKRAMHTEDSRNGLSTYDSLMTASEDDDEDAFELSPASGEVSRSAQHFDSPGGANYSW